jgi:VCBS repeat-containing protein
VTKGMAEVEGSNKDMNYFLGIRQSDSVLTADFEDTATGLNHPVAGVTAIPANGAWHHAAATYDGTTWRLYLDGVLDAQLVVGAFTPRADSIQHAAIGTALNSTGVVTSGQTQGLFDGVVDEARVWNYPRTIGQISRGKNFEIANAPGLLGRWSFNAGTGTVLADSTGHAINGTVTGAGFAWVTGVPFPTQGNTAPTAAADPVTTPEDTAIVVAVVSNDQDADGDVLTVTSASAGLHGTTVLAANGSITYTPAANYNGADSFTYGLSDNQGGVSTGTVSVTVTPANDAPVAANDSYSATEDQALTVAAPGVLGNDSDLDLETITAVLVTPPAHGTLTLNADGSFTYTSAPNYVGGDSFTYRASDGVAQSGLATVAIGVANANDAPAGAPDTYAATEDTTLTVAAPGVLANDTDADDDPLSVVALASPAHGSLMLNMDGSLVYTPALNFNGTDTPNHLEDGD